MNAPSPARLPVPDCGVCIPLSRPPKAVVALRRPSHPERFVGAMVRVMETMEGFVCRANGWTEATNDGATAGSGAKRATVKSRQRKAAGNGWRGTRGKRAQATCASVPGSAKRMSSRIAACCWSAADAACIRGVQCRGKGAQSLRARDGHTAPKSPLCRWREDVWRLPQRVRHVARSGELQSAPVVVRQTRVGAAVHVAEGRAHPDVIIPQHQEPTTTGAGVSVVSSSRRQTVAIQPVAGGGSTQLITAEESGERKSCVW